MTIEYRHKDWWIPIYYKVRIRATNKWFDVISYGFGPSKCDWMVPVVNRWWFP